MRGSRNSLLAAPLFSAALWMAPATAPAATAENIVYDMGAVQIAIPRVEATGGSLTDAELSAILDPRSPEPLARRLEKLQAASIAAPQINFDVKVGPVANRVVYRDFILTNVANGKIDSATIAGATADMKDPAGGDVKAVYGAMSMRKVDLGLLLRWFTTARVDPNEPLTSIYEDFSAEGFSMTSKDVDMSFGKMIGSGFKARAMARPGAELFSLSQQFPAAGAQPSPEQMALITSVLADLFQSMEIGKIEAVNMKVRPKKEPGEIGIGRLFMGGFAKGKLAELAYENLEMKMPDGNAKLGRFALRDLDLQRTFATFADAIRRGDMDFSNTNPRDLVPTLGQFQIAGLDLDVPSKDGKGNSPDGKRIRFSLGKFEINLSNFIEGIPSTIGAALQNFVFPVPKNPADPQLRDVAALGLDRIDLSHNIDIAWSEAAREIAIKDYSLNLAGLGQARLSGVIGNVPKDLFSANIALVQATAFGALIKSVNLAVDNQGMVEKGLALGAKQNKQTPQQLKQSLVSGASVGVPALLGNGPAAKAIGNALAKFIAEPKRLRINARAKDGLGAADLMLLGNPAALLEKIEVTASANE